jgi:hypothetical protein
VISNSFSFHWHCVLSSDSHILKEAFISWMVVTLGTMSREEELKALVQSCLAYLETVPSLNYQTAQ